MKTNQTINSMLALVALLTFNLQLTTASAQGSQMFPIVTNDTAATSFTAACAGSNYLVGIQGDYVGSNSYQITAQLFGPDGTPVGARINPVPGHTGGNSFPASSGTNELMAWPDDYNNGIVGQIISPSGALVGSWFVIYTSSNPEDFSSLAYGDGKYLATWNDYSNGPNWTFYGRLVSASGALLGGILSISQPVNGQDEQGGSVAFDGTNFLVVWQFCSASNHYVTDGVFNSPSGVMGTPFAIGQTVSSTRNVHGGAFALFNGTNYFVVWNLDSGLGSTNARIWNIYGRFMTPSGAFLGNEFAIVTNGNPTFPGLAFDGINYLLSWNVNFGATNSNIQCQFLNANGQLMGPQFSPFTAQGSEVPLATFPIYDGKRFVLVTSLSAGGFTPTNDAAIYGTFIPASTTTPQFCAGTTYSGQKCCLSLAGTPGINYAIQMTTNLVAPSWTSIVTNSPTNGTFVFSDAGATNRSRYYRALKQ